MMSKKIKGSITIEAAVALPLFMLGYFLIISFISVIRTESTVQYAVNQTAKEIAQYCYVADRLSSSVLSDCTDGKLNELIVGIGGFSGLLQNDSDGSDESESGDVIKSLTMLISNTVANELIGRRLADSVCHRLMPKYIAENRSEADKYLMGLSGITVDDIDFRYSRIIGNDKSVKITAVYKIKLNTFGLFGDKGITLTMKNSAHTAAWVRNSVRSREEAEGESRWTLGNFDRGRSWVRAIKDENSSIAVASGHGTDLYDRNTNTFTQIYSVNVFAQSYSDYEQSSGNEGVMCYTLKGDAYHEVIKKYAMKLRESMKNSGNSIAMESGTAYPVKEKDKKGRLIIIVPEEAADSKQMSKELKSISDDICKEYEIELELLFRDKALK